MSPLPSVRVVGTGAHHPARCIPNAVFDERFGPGVGDWLVDNLWIRQRYWMEEGERTSDLAVVAAERALEAAGLASTDLDLLVVATDTPDYVSPSTASVVQHRLGATRAGTFDLNSACSGFVAAVDQAAASLQARPGRRHALVIGAYGMSRFLNPDDKKTVTLFADGAGAVVLSVDPSGEGILGCDLATEGRYHDWMGIYAGGTAAPVTPERLAAHEHQLVFARKFPKEINPLTWTRMIQEQASTLGFSPQDVALYVFTQLNVHSIHETLDALEVPRDRAVTVMDHLGYTGSACIPMALDHAARAGRLSRGDLVMLVASGGGLSFASMALRW